MTLQKYISDPIVSENLTSYANFDRQHCADRSKSLKYYDATAQSGVIYYYKVRAMADKVPSGSSNAVTRERARYQFFLPKRSLWEKIEVMVTRLR